MKTLDDVDVTVARDFDFHATYVSSPSPLCILTYRPQLQERQYLGRTNKRCYGKNIKSNVMMCEAIIRER